MSDVEKCKLYFVHTAVMVNHGAIFRDQRLLPASLTPSTLAHVPALAVTLHRRALLDLPEASPRHVSLC
jgi:hypothetical protein